LVDGLAPQIPLDGARNAALKRLLRAPAPDLPALAPKIDLAVDEEVATLAGGERCLRC
jgi:hypothetical protein